jgi:rhodanese-related sulfurtransferase
MRRSLSMFEHAADVVKARPEEVAVEKSAAMTAPIKAEAPDFISALPQKFALPHFASSEVSDTIPRISGDTLSEVMDGRYDDEFDNKLIIDCRFEYEFAGGHINGAINFNDKGDLSQHLFEAPPTGRTLLVFHCEFSKVRAPMMARYVRSEDRAYNADRYPFLSYPEVYILQDGYCGYFISNRQRCFPPIHIAMDDDKYRKERSQGLSRLKTRKVISRARTFAFGEHRAPAVPDAVPDLSTIRRARHSPPPDEDVKAIFTDGSKPAGSDDGAQVVAEPRYNSKVAGGGKPLLFDPPKNGIRCKAKILFGQSRSSGTLGKAGGAEDLFGEPISGGGAKTATTTAAMTTDMFGEPKAASTTDLFGEPKAAGSSISRSSSISRGSSTRDLFGEPTTSSSARGLFGEAKASSSARDLFGEPKAASTAADLFGVTTPRAAGSLGERVTFEEDDVFGLPKLSDSVTERRASGPASLIERRAGGANPLNAERRASGPSPLIERRASGANPFKADRRASGPDVLGERRSSGTDLFASQPKSRTAALFGAPKLTRAATFGEHPKSATATTLSEARSASRSSSGSSSSASLLLREPKSASAVSFGGETTSRASSRARLSEIFADSSPIANSAAAASPISPPPRLAARLDAIDMIGNSPILGERPKSKDSRRMSSY